MKALRRFLGRFIPYFAQPKQHPIILHRLGPADYTGAIAMVNYNGITYYVVWSNMVRWHCEIPLTAETVRQLDDWRNQLTLKANNF